MLFNVLRLSTAAMVWMALGPALSAAQDSFVEDFTLQEQAYLGQWFELARTPNDFEDNQPVVDGIEYGPCFSSTATYGTLRGDRISIVNECKREPLTGQGEVTVDRVTGVGHILPDSEGRKLKIAFGNPLERFFFRLFTLGGADYWIYGVGEINAEGLYQWAVVSGPERDSIFVLAREPKVSESTLHEIYALIEAEGLPASELIFIQR